MPTIDINNGDSVLTLTTTGIAATYTAGNAFQAGATGVIGLHLWPLIVLGGGSAVNAITFAVEVSNDATNWAAVLSIPHDGAGAQNTEPQFAGLVAGATVLKHISVPPQYLGSAKYVRLKAKANAAGGAGDSLTVKATGW